MIIDERLPRPAVLLISDLEDDPSDVPKVTSVALAYRREGSRSTSSRSTRRPVTSSSTGDSSAGGASYTPARLRANGAEAASRGSFPLGLAAIALAVALLLGAYELWSARLTWAGRPRTEGTA